ncbi:hypothetical protein [Blastococcus sp. SYSU DS1021]
MTTPRKTKTNAAAAVYEAARRNREAAERAHADAVAALAAAEEHHADLIKRNRNGDTTVTGMDLLSADADVTVRRGLAASAADAVAAARAAEAPALAEHWAEVLADRVATPGIGAEDVAVDEVTAALTKLTEGVNSRQRLMAEAIADARAVGVPMGAGMPFGWETHWIGNRPTAVLVRGERVPIVSPSEAMLDVLTRAAGSLGYRLVSSHNAVTVKTA